jgi:hypothetical protein
MGKQSCDRAEAAFRCADDREDSAGSPSITAIVVDPVDRAGALDF